MQDMHNFKMGETVIYEPKLMKRGVPVPPEVCTIVGFYTEGRVRVLNRNGDKRQVSIKHIRPFEDKNG
jgi:hypothetical protein